MPLSSVVNHAAFGVVPRVGDAGDLAGAEDAVIPDRRRPADRAAAGAVRRSSCPGSRRSRRSSSCASDPRRDERDAVDRARRRAAACRGWRGRPPRARTARASARSLRTRDAHAGHVLLRSSAAMSRRGHAGERIDLDLVAAVCCLAAESRRMRLPQLRIELQRRLQRAGPAHRRIAWPSSIEPLAPEAHVVRVVRHVAEELHAAAPRAPCAPAPDGGAG